MPPSPVLLNLLMPPILLAAAGAGLGAEPRARAAEALAAAPSAIGLPPLGSGHPTPPAGTVLALASSCPADAPVPTPAGWQGWDRSGVIGWEEIERAGGVVPEIEEDASQSPPGWWRYPSPLRSAALLEAEARDARWGLYGKVEPRALARGDILIRTAADAVGGTCLACGPCGKMAVLRERTEGRWGTVEVDAEGRGAAQRVGSAMFFGPDGQTLLPGIRVFRMRVKKEDTIGHIRELGRDLRHLERTVGDSPAMLASGEGAEDVVAEKIHDLIDEAWSLVAEEAYDVDRRELASRGYALGAALGWPAAAESGLALVDDVLARAPERADAWVTHGVLSGLLGQPARALLDARTALGRGAEAAGADPGSLDPPGLPARWLEVRALLAAGDRAGGEAALERFVARVPGDRRALRLQARMRANAAAGAGAGAGAGVGVDAGGPVSGPDIPMSPIAPAAADGISYFASTERAGLESHPLGFRVSWPLTWRLAQVAASPATGVLASLSTGRALLDDGRAERASAVLLAQKPAGAAARAALLRDGLRKMFPTAKVRALPPLVPGSRRSQFHDQQPEGTRVGEVVTLERAGAVFFLVLNASADLYPKLTEDYATFVRSLASTGASRAPAASTPSPSPAGPSTQGPRP
jgi:hypothetical protein